MNRMIITKTRLSPETLERIREIVTDAKGHDAPKHRNKAEIIRTAVQRYVDKIWQPPIFMHKKARRNNAKAARVLRKRKFARH